MEGTVKEGRALGYTDEQARLMGVLDDVFEEAIEAGLVSGADAIVVGQVVGTMSMRHTGKTALMSPDVRVKVYVNEHRVV
ncbi:hypothetical protein ES708_22424 [subsurface metagenome]